MAREMKGDILSIEQGMICHQVNCMGKMGAGVALGIRRKYLVVYEAYMEAFRTKQLFLGYAHFVAVTSTLAVANLCGQYGYGRTGLYTNYDAVRLCLQAVASVTATTGQQVYIPKGMGCSLAGGDWNVVSSIIEETVPSAIVVDYNQPKTWRR